MFKCEVCGKEFKNWFAYNGHRVLAHRRAKKECTKCRGHFAIGAPFTRHFKACGNKIGQAFCKNCGKEIKKPRMFCGISCSNIFNQKTKPYHLTENSYITLDPQATEKIKEFFFVKKLMKKDIISLGFSKRLVYATLKGHKGNRRLSQKQKEAISIKQKELSKLGIHHGWRHINQRTDTRSYPEKVLYKYLEESGIVKKHTIIEKLHVFKYFLDFAIIDLKIDLEMDGQQHFSSLSAIQHDKERDIYLINQGWKVYRIAWINFLKNQEKEKQDLFSFIENSRNNSSHFYSIEEVITKYKNSGKTKHTRKEYFSIAKDKYEAKEKLKIPLLANSNIDFSEQGWVGKAAIILNIHYQKVSKWMKRFLPEFYKNCFQRHIPVTEQSYGLCNRNGVENAGSSPVWDENKGH